MRGFGNRSLHVITLHLLSLLHSLAVLLSSAFFITLILCSGVRIAHGITFSSTKCQGATPVEVFNIVNVSTKLRLARPRGQFRSSGIDLGGPGVDYFDILHRF